MSEDVRSRGRTVFYSIEGMDTAVLLALDGGLRQPKAAVCAILTLWGHGNRPYSELHIGQGVPVGEADEARSLLALDKE